jgi:hypothetical protein
MHTVCRRPLSGRYSVFTFYQPSDIHTVSLEVRQQTLVTSLPPPPHTIIRPHHGLINYMTPKQNVVI